jgi:hypothetical protein
MRFMPDPTGRYEVAVWLGTNAHELGHVLYSPRAESALMQRIIAANSTVRPGIAQLANVVEDQRQERLLLARFAPWRGYLVAALAHHLSTGDDGAWLLLCGRTWLPDDVRAKARARFAAVLGDQATATVARIVGEYQLLADPGDGDADEAWALLDELFALVPPEVTPTGPVCTVIQGGDPDTSTPGKAVPATADEADRRLSADDDADDGDQGDDDDAVDGRDGDAADSDDGGRQASDQSSGTGSPEKGSSEGKGDPPKGVAEALRDAAGDALDDADVADDLDRVVETLDVPAATSGASGDSAPGEFREADDSARRLEVEVTDALIELKDAVEPGWVRRTDSGRFNVRRWAFDPHAELDDVFDRYEPGHLEAAEFDVVVLVDVSSSMSRAVWKVAEATWAIRRAVDALEGRCTVLTYNDLAHGVLAAGERPDGRVFTPQAWGGTNPHSALVEAYRLMTDSQATNRVVLILTDGDWEAKIDNDAVIASLNRAGVLTALAGYGYLSASGLDHGTTVAERIDRPGDLARMFGRLAAEQIRVRLG